MYKAVFFDLDGTLLNTLDDLADSCNHVLAAKGYQTYPVEQYKKFVGNGAAVLMTRIHPAGTSQNELDDSLAKFTAYYSAHKDIKTTPYPGIPELLKKLRSAGIHLCVRLQQAARNQRSDRQTVFRREHLRHHYGQISRLSHQA